MEDIYVNVEEVRPVNPKDSTNRSGPRSSEKSSCLGVTVFLGLLSVFLLAGLIVLGVHYHHSVRDSAAELSAIKDNITAERDLLSNRTKELESLSEQNRKLHASAAELSAVKDNLTDLLQTSYNNLSSMTKEIDLLKANLTELVQTSNNKPSTITEERDLLKANPTEMT